MSESSFEKSIVCWTISDECRFRWYVLIWVMRLAMAKNTFWIIFYPIVFRENSIFDNKRWTTRKTVWKTAANFVWHIPSKIKNFVCNLQWKLAQKNNIKWKETNMFDGNSISYCVCFVFVFVVLFSFVCAAWAESERRSQRNEVREKKTKWRAKEMDRIMAVSARNVN